LRYLFGKNRKIFKVLEFLVKTDKEVSIKDIKKGLNYKEKSEYVYYHLEKLVNAGIVLKIGEKGTYRYKIRSKELLFQFFDES
ncbi:MAG: winged helix-turn-helix domain-containing protein, partial [Methanomicrobiaceae archaeon]|nr:winged helix-turn-helix domain-containing protein [Methanomicrobiaceae archaeon]